MEDWQQAQYLNKANRQNELLAAQMEQLAMQAKLQQMMQRNSGGQAYAGQSERMTPGQGGFGMGGLSSAGITRQSREEQAMAALKQKLERAQIEAQMAKLAQETEQGQIQLQNLASQASDKQYKSDAWRRAYGPYMSQLGQDPNSMSIAQRADPRLGSSIDAANVWRGSAEPWKRAITFSNNTNASVGNQQNKSSVFNYRMG